MLVRVFSYMFYMFVAVNGLWFYLCHDGKGFFTTVGFGDKMIGVSRWLASITIHVIQSFIS